MLLGCPLAVTVSHPSVQCFEVALHTACCAYASLGKLLPESHFHKKDVVFCTLRHDANPNGA